MGQTSRPATFAAAPLCFTRCPTSDTSFVEFLAKLGANLSPVDSHGCTPLDIATMGRDTRMIALLERLGGSRKDTEADAFATAVISIGQDAGGPDDGLMWPTIHLDRMLAKHCTTTHCPAIDQFSLVLRVSGKFADFGPEAIERIRRRRLARYITADIVIPVQRWKGKTERQLKKYLAGQVRSCLEMLVARLRKDKEAVDDTAFFRNVDAGIAEFLRTRTPHEPCE